MVLHPLANGKWSIAIPVTPSLNGILFCNQAAVRDTSANALGYVVSDMGRGVLGSK